MKLKLTLAAAALLSFNAFAEEAETEESPYKASAELGALYKTGNSETSDILAGLDIEYTQDLWKAIGAFDLLVRKSEVEQDDGDKRSETTDQKWKVAGQANYTINEARQNYLYASGEYEDDRFSGFENQWSVSAGWGRRWYETEVATFDADFGPGFKRDVISETDTMEEETKDSFVVQAQAKYVRKINEHVEFEQYVKVTHAVESGENSKYHAKSSIVTRLMTQLQLKFSFTVDHNTDVDEGIENTDTQTGITLVYSF